MPKFETGDAVVIARAAPTRVPGEFENSWLSTMDGYVGKPDVYTVASVTTAGISLKSASGVIHPNRWPPSALDYAPKTKGSCSVELKLEDRVYVNGNNAADLKDEQLISLISDAETEADRLSKLTTASAAIKAKIAMLQAGAEKLAALLDARTPPPIG